MPPDEKNTILLIGLPDKTTLNKTSEASLQFAGSTEEHIVLQCEHTAHKIQTVRNDRSDGPFSLVNGQEKAHCLRNVKDILNKTKISQNYLGMHTWMNKIIKNAER